MKVSRNLKSAVFFDRDGVITIPQYDSNSNKGYAARRPTDLKLYSNCGNIIRKIRSTGFLTFIISNQPDIALNKIKQSTKIKLEKTFQSLLATNQIKFEEIKYCNHHEQSINPNYSRYCSCRKPKPGMIFELAEKWSLDLGSSFIIGDTWRDIEAGRKAGCKTILVKRPWSLEKNCEPTFTVDNLQNALDIIQPQ